MKYVLTPPEIAEAVGEYVARRNNLYGPRESQTTFEFDSEGISSATVEVRPRTEDKE